MTPRVDPRALLRGVHGVESATTGPVALVVVDGVRRLVDSIVPHLGRGQAATAAEVEAWARSIEVVAAAYRRSMSAEDADSGHVLGSVDGLGHGDTWVRSVTTAEAAELLGLTDRQVRRLCEGPAPALRSRRLGRAYSIDPKSIDDYLATRRRTA
jgi:hypothetical protein